MQITQDNEYKDNLEVDAHTALQNHFTRYAWDNTLRKPPAPPNIEPEQEIYPLDI